MKVKRFEEFELSEKKKKTPGIGSLVPEYKRKRRNDRSHLDMLRKKLELQDVYRKRREEEKEDKEKEKEPEYKEAGPVKKLLKKAGDFIKGEVTKTYVPPRYY